MPHLLYYRNGAFQELDERLTALRMEKKKESLKKILNPKHFDELLICLALSRCLHLNI
jgi:hypothetical protein